MGPWYGIAQSQNHTCLEDVKTSPIKRATCGSLFYFREYMLRGIEIILLTHIHFYINIERSIFLLLCTLKIINI